MESKIEKKKWPPVRVSKRFMDRIERLLGDEDEKIIYANKRHFVDVAVGRLLDEEERKQKEMGGK